jgi:hypothetical protein
MPPLKNLGHELFLLMVSLGPLKDRDGIARVFGEALSSLFEGFTFEFVKDEPAETSLAIEAAGPRTRHGWVAVRGPWEKLPSDRAALIRNAVKMPALILENRLQAEEPAGENDRFESAVQDRTEDLVRLNKEASE